MWFWTIAGVARATPIGCDVTVDKESFDFLLIRAEQAIGMLDAEELGESTDRARALAACLEVELTPIEVARLYRLSGIARYVNDDLVEAVKDFAVARALDPNAVIDPQLGKPLRQTYDAVPPSSGERVSLPRPEEGWLVVDGTRDDQAPADRGYLLQWVREDGLPHATYLVEKGQIPTYPLRGGGSGGGGGGGGSAAGKVLLVSGLVIGATGVAGMTGSYLYEREFDSRPNVPSAKMAEVISRNHTYGWAGIGLGAAGAGMIGAAIAVGF